MDPQHPINGVWRCTPVILALGRRGLLPSKASTELLWISEGTRLAMFTLGVQIRTLPVYLGVVVHPCSLAEDELIWKIVELLKEAGDRLEEEVRRQHQRSPAGLLQLRVRAPPALPS